MNISVQFLEGGPASASTPPAQARKILRAAFDRLPVGDVLLGWNLPPALVEACAEECGRARADLYLWHPLLAGDGVFTPRLEWRTVSVDGNPIGDAAGRDEFTFVCPNRTAAREAVMRRLEHVLAGGFFKGIFFDRIRFPSPAADITRDLACFCDDCSRAAKSAGVDWAQVRARTSGLLETPEGKRAIIRRMLPGENPPAGSAEDAAVDELMAFRCRSVTAIVRDAARMARARGWKVGLDCFSPALAPLVGQNLAELSAGCDWIKGMTYLRAFGPAAIPYELLGLADALRAPGVPDDGETLDFLARHTGWQVPARREEIRRGRLPSSILAAEIARGRQACKCRFLAGVELVEIPGVADLDPELTREDWRTLAAAAPDGVVLAWDLRFISLEHLEMVGRILCGSVLP
ncbi:MAG: hypothetical protein A3K46_00560 [Chloroflexi bacterium RBG_13_60_9]|nr:MAG: hypothetical protein A3K46_00560 [Chloroflexi bacterium RBG_13_60_9]